MNVEEYQIDSENSVLNSDSVSQLPQTDSINELKDNICLNSDIKIQIDLRKDENQFYFDHSIDFSSDPVFPAAGYICIVWEEFARQLSVPRDELPIIVENLRLLRPTFLTKPEIIEFNLKLSLLNGEFQFYQAGRLLVTGRIREPKKGEPFLPLRRKAQIQSTDIEDDQFKLKKEDIYKWGSVRGFDFGPQFRSIVSLDFERGRAKMKYTNNWITIIDAVFQVPVILSKARNVFLPTLYSVIHCDPRLVSKSTSVDEVVSSNLRANYMLTNGIEVYGCVVTNVMRRTEERLCLERYVWLPYMDNNALIEDMKQLVEIYVQLLEELINNEPKLDRKLDTSQLNNRLGLLLNINGLKEECLVLKDVIEGLNTINENESIEQLVTTFGPKLSSDLLNTLYFDESLLRPIIDIILENTSIASTQEFKVFEINPNQEISYDYVINYLNDSFYNLNVKYSVYNPNDMYSDSVIDETQNDQFNRVTVDFSVSPDSDGYPINLVIIREPLPTKEHEEIKTEDIYNEELLKYVYNNLETNGFLIIFRREQFTSPEKTLLSRFEYKIDESLTTTRLITMAEGVGFSLVSHRTDGNTSSVLLFRKIDQNKNNEDIIILINHSEYDLWIEKLKTELKKSEESNSNQRTIWLVSEIKDFNGVIGLVNCLRKEPGGLNIRCITDVMFDDMRSTGSVSLKEMIDSSIYDNNLVMNIYKNEKLGSFRYLNLNRNRFNKSWVNHAILMPLQYNKKTTLHWVESKHNLFVKNESFDDNIIVNILYTGLNPKDVEKETIPQSFQEYTHEEKGFCSEFSGLDNNGKRIFGIKTNASLATTLVIRSGKDLINVPDHWSLQEACTVPYAYGTAYYALVLRAQLKSNNSILIHSGNGYIGRAAIAIALYSESQIYVTVPTEEAKTELITEFSHLDETNVINTSIDCFKEIISNKTSGKGVDILFDYTNEYSLDSNLFCVNQNGRYLFTGDPALQGTDLICDKNIIIEKINFEELFAESEEQSDSSEESDNLKYSVLRLIEDGIVDKVVKPFDCKVFDVDMASDALQSLTKSQYNQKVLVRIRDESKLDLEENIDTITTDLSVNAVHNTRFEKDRSYIITGGLGGFGLELALWMVEAGAGHLVLTTRSGVKNNYQEYYINRLKNMGAQVLIVKTEAVDEVEVENLLKETNLMAPVAGIFSLAMVLSDRLFKNQTKKSMERVLQPKAELLRNLDLISRDLCPHLKYFVAFSSLTSGRGNAGQSNYGYANSYMERLCEARHSDHLPALAIQWGAIADAGVVAENFDQKELSINGISGTIPQRLYGCLSLMNHFLRSNYSVVSSFVRFEKK